jgi:hypothetical protein
VRALAAGEHIEAVQYFQRYQRLEKSPLAQWEAAGHRLREHVAQQPLLRCRGRPPAYVDCRHDEPEGKKHHSIVLMQQALETFVLMERHVEDLENRAACSRRIWRSASRRSSGCGN